MQLLVLLPDDPIALAGPLQQARSIENADGAATVTDQGNGLKLARGLSNPHATHTEEACHRYLNHLKLA